MPHDMLLSLSVCPTSLLVMCFAFLSSSLVSSTRETVMKNPRNQPQICLGVHSKEGFYRRFMFERLHSPLEKRHCRPMSLEYESVVICWGLWVVVVRHRLTPVNRQSAAADAIILITVNGCRWRGKDAVGIPCEWRNGVRKWAACSVLSSHSRPGITGMYSASGFASILDQMHGIMCASIVSGTAFNNRWYRALERLCNCASKHTNDQSWSIQYVSELPRSYNEHRVKHCWTVLTIVACRSRLECYLSWTRLPTVFAGKRWTKMVHHLKINKHGAF